MYCKFITEADNNNNNILSTGPAENMTTTNMTCRYQGVPHQDVMYLYVSLNQEHWRFVANVYLYENTATPEIYSVAPAYGPIHGNTMVEITGKLEFEYFFNVPEFPT